MGNKVVKQGVSAASRPIKNYNVEERAFKVISRDKPKAAPPHPAMEKIMKEIKNDPTLLEKGKPDPELSNKLKKVYITSTGDNPVIETKRYDYKLPKDRHFHDDYEYGYEEPKVIPEGKATFRQVIEFLGKHQNDPENYTAEHVAKEYNLKIETAKQILENFRPFELYTPPPVKEHRSLIARVVKS